MSFLRYDIMLTRRMPLLSSIQHPDRTAEYQAVLPAMIQSLMATLHSYEDLFGPYHPQTFAVLTKLAVALWNAGQIRFATSMLERAIPDFTSTFGSDHPSRLEALTVLSGLLFEQCSFEEASAVQREIVNCRLRHEGPDDPNSMIAKADLAAILFELGDTGEANRLEQESFESARACLGAHHFVTTLIAWNRLHRHEQRGDLEVARNAMVNDLIWLLPEDPEQLDTCQNTIRKMLAKRLNWDMPAAC